jgi:long-subunit acyl-CoA synthetase (AMP-forming)
LEYVKFLLESKVTRLIGTVSSLQKLRVACGEEKRSLPGIKSITVGVGSISKDLYDDYTGMGIQVSQCYGQAENAWTLTMQNIDFENDMFFWEKGAVGKGLPGVKYKVIDSQGDEIPGSGFRKGQLAVSGPTVMLKYAENDEDTKKAIRGTWLYTGDLVEVDGEEDKMSVIFLGRKEDALIVKGKFVILDSLNSVFQSDSLKNLVREGAVFWVKNSQNKQAVVCVVVKAEHRTLTDKEVINCFIENGSGDLTPVAVAFTDSIPKELSGQPNAWKLRRQFSSLGG